MKRIVFSKAALKTLAKMPSNTARLIRSKIEAYAANPASQVNNVKALRGQDEIRLRVGDWRVIMNDRGEIIESLKSPHAAAPTEDTKMNNMITIPRAEYDRLIEIAEDAEDIRSIEEFKAKLERGEEEFVPSEFVDRMLDGENLLKLWREHRGLSQRELAKASGVNRIQIGDIEDRGKTGSVTTLKKLADTLGVQVDDLVA